MHIFKKTLGFSLVLLCITITPVRAQFDDFNFFDGGIEDGIELFTPYVTPWVNAFGTDLNGGWFNTAKPHKLGGFDITFTVSASIIPESDRSFDLSQLNFRNLQVMDPDPIGPTVAGKTNNGPLLEYSTGGQTDVTIASFPSPPGSSVHVLPAPMIQAGVGLPKGTEIVGRFMPKVKIPSTQSRIGLWGVGLKHSIAQHIKGLKVAPVDISVFGGYTKLNSDIGFSYNPYDYENIWTIDPNLSYTSADFNNQQILVETSGYNLSLIVSTTLPVINVYGSIGYSGSTTKIVIDGKIPIPGYNPILDPLNPSITDGDIETIPEIRIENISGLRTSIGARLKMTVVTIHADYTYAKYSVITAGIGLNFR